MKGHIRRGLSIILSLLLLFSLRIPTYASVSSVDSLIDNQAIYNFIVDDYLELTGLTRLQADEIFERVNSTGLDVGISGYIERKVFGSNVNLRYEDKALFVQENYQVVIRYLSNADKALVDEYFLTLALRYYQDYSDPSEFVITESPSPNEGAPLVPNEQDYLHTFEQDELSLEPIVPSRSNVARVRIFAVSDGGGSSSSFTGHAWLTVENITSYSITVGKIIVGPGKTLSIGTWGNKSEHTGLWYSLEPYFLYKDSSSYSGRVSLLVQIDSSTLATLSSHITSYDQWTATNNCSTFAAKGWNKICSTTVSAGVINTPSGLKTSIVNTGMSNSNVAVPYHYSVYYANGTGTPVLSSVWK